MAAAALGLQKNRFRRVSTGDAKLLPSESESGEGNGFSGGRKEIPAVAQLRAASSSSPVRIRHAFSTSSTKIFPSPIFPVWAASLMALIAAS